MMKRKDFFDDYKYASNRTMEVNGLKCTFHMPDAVKRVKNYDGTEGVAGLPPGKPRPAFAVDEYPASPNGWMHGSGEASSYFVPVAPEKGMWLDFNANVSHTHDVAVVVSVQGINPLTGIKSDPIRLEQYREKCPKHQREFKQGLFCDDCKFKWHPQNYVASNATPRGLFWIDGFRAEDGVVRQWYFTEEECKGIAAQVIGDERVYAIGIAFYLSKKPKPQPTYNLRSLRSSGGGWLGSKKLGGPGGQSYGGQHTNSGGYYGSSGGGGGTFSCNSGGGPFIGASWDAGDFAHIPTGEVSHDSLSIEPLGDIYNEQRLGSFEAEAAAIEDEQVTLEIGAGAKIDQKIHRDTEKLDYWQEEAAGFIYINYCDVDTAQKILEVGKRQETPEGFMANLEIKDE